MTTTVPSHELGPRPAGGRHNNTTTYNYDGVLFITDGAPNYIAAPSGTGARL